MIEISDITMEFQTHGEPFRALDSISLTIPEGCIYGFLGSNGAGKSTLMRMMCGVYKPNVGTIKLDGEDVFDNPNAKGKIFFVNDETVQYTKFTLEGLEKYYACMYPTFSQITFDRLAAKLNLPRNKRLSEFSKGMKRQSLVIIALACGTKYLMLDEAFDGLDPAMRRMIKNLIIDELVDKQATMIVSSHNIAEINELCDRAMLIHQGKLIFANEIDEIKSGFRKVQIAFKDRIPTPDAIRSTGVDVMEFDVTGSVARIIARGEESDLMKRLYTLTPTILEVIPLTLEEIFIYELEVRGYGSELINEDF